MPEFKSYRSYHKFATSVTKRWRYTRNPEQSDFLESVLSTGADKAEVLKVGLIVARAQVGYELRPTEVAEGHTEELPSPFSTDRMKPRAGRAFEGRVNPKGIPCLYVATHEETAIAEVRPWVGASVSVAQLKTVRDLRVMNCTTDEHRTRLYLKEPEAKERERAVWQHIDQAFSRPVTISDDVASYVPTQISGEEMKA